MNLKQQIHEAMKEIAKRRPGRRKLVYDRATRTIIEVDGGGRRVKGVCITLQEADMFCELRSV